MLQIHIHPHWHLLGTITTYDEALVIFIFGPFHFSARYIKDVQNIKFNTPIKDYIANKYLDLT